MPAVRTFQTGDISTKMILYVPHNYVCCDQKIEEKDLLEDDCQMLSREKIKPLALNWVSPCYLPSQ